MKLTVNPWTPIGVIFGMAGLLFAAWQAKKTDDVHSKLNLALNEIDTKTEVQVRDDIVNAAIQRAIDREVHKAVNEAANKVRDDIHADVDKRVRNEVTANFDAIKNEVSEKISEQVANIDQYALQETVKKQAEKKILQKFDGSLDGILGDYKRQLANVTKVWDSVSDALAYRKKDEGRTMSFRLD